MSTAGATPVKERLLRELLDQVAAQLPRDRADLVSPFARAYVRRFPASEAEVSGGEELFGQVMGAFELAAARGREPIAVRALTPTLAADGYTTVGSVIETNTPDSPFLVDSVTEAIAAHGLAIRLVVHPVVGIERDDEGRIVAVKPVSEAAATESVMHFELERRLDANALELLADDLRRVLADVQSAVSDFPTMLVRLEGMIEVAREAAARYDAGGGRGGDRLPDLDRRGQPRLSRLPRVRDRRPARRAVDRRGERLRASAFFVTRHRRASQAAYASRQSNRRYASGSRPVTS